MSLNIKENGALRRIAGSTVILDATASEIREGTWTNTEIDTATGDTRIEANITFDVPMPDTDYMVVFDKPVTGHGESYNYINVSTKSTTGFTFFVTYTGNLTHTPLGLQIHWYAVRLVKLDGYTELQNKVNNPDSTPTENSTNLVTSGGVYDAIKNASSVFIGTSSEWESEVSKTDYQVAILTDKPNVNAVDSTTGDIEVVANKNLVFKGTLDEWEALTTAEKKIYDEALITNDMDTGEVVDAVTNGDTRAVTSNAVYDALTNSSSLNDFTLTYVADDYWTINSFYYKAYISSNKLVTMNIIIEAAPKADFNIGHAVLATFSGFPMGEQIITSSELQYIPCALYKGGDGVSLNGFFSNYRDATSQREDLGALGFKFDPSYTFPANLPHVFNYFISYIAIQ